MQFIIKAYDGEGMLEKRMNARPRHLNSIKRLGRQVICAGGLLDDEGRMKGSALVLEFPDRAALNEYLANEPYVVEGVWEKVEIEVMNVVLVNGEKRFMGCDIIRINENSWRIEDSGVRFFLLTGTEKALLIDTGMNVHNVKEITMSLTKLPVFLLNTHADRDHIGCNEQFESFYMHQADADAYRQSGKSGTVIPIQGGDTLDLGERELRIIHLPGHTPGSIAVLDIKNRVLISGDPIQENGRIFMFGMHRNMENYIKSLEHLESYKDQFDEIWPSHADIPVTPDIIMKLHDGAKGIVSGKAPSSQTELFGNKVSVYNLGFCTFLCDQ